ncbi:MAG: hypothetical protein LBK63_08550 [Treponema sp.]|jgi:hypothetical protein|nr:hypothetical protein [Treponema sp.]
MSSGKDWIPGPDKEFSDFFENYIKIVVANTALSKPVWTHIPDERVNELSDSYGGPWQTP